MPVLQNCQAGESPALQKPYTSKSLQVRVPLPGAVQANQRLTAKISRLVANKRAYSQVRQDQQLTAPSYWLSALSYWLSSSAGDESPG